MQCVLGERKYLASRLRFQQSSPSFHWHNPMSSNGEVFRRTAHPRGEVVSGFKSRGNSSCVRVAEKSLSCANSMPTCTKGGACNFNSPKRCSEKSRILGSISGSPRPRISLMWAANALAALPSLRREKTGIKGQNLATESRSFQGFI